MINFGVREVVNTKASVAPGWAYVPDTGKVNSLQPVSRKRVRTELTASQHDTTAKQDAKIIRDLAALDRESHREVSIPVPVRHRDNAGRGKLIMLGEG
jgi:zinc finger HIT domain-containing protein 1